MTPYDPARIVAVTLGVLLAFSGAIHGLFETAQGAAPVVGWTVEAIGPAQRHWLHGNEPAFTVMPTHRAAGLAVLAVALGVAVWTLTRIHRPGGPAGFLALMLLLTLVGGGIGHIPLFLSTWGWSSALPRPPKPWHRRLGRTRLSRAWPGALAGAALSWLIAQHISVYGRVPGLADPDTILVVCWSFLGAALVLGNLAFPLALGARTRLNPPAR